MTNTVIDATQDTKKANAVIVYALTEMLNKALTQEQRDIVEVARCKKLLDRPRERYWADLKKKDKVGKKQNRLLRNLTKAEQTLKTTRRFIEEARTNLAKVAHQQELQKEM